MNALSKTAVVAAVALVAVAGYTRLSQNATLDHLNATFPNLDQKVMKRVYQQMLLEAFVNQGYPDCTNTTLDDIFLDKYDKMIAKKK